MTFYEFLRVSMRGRWFVDFGSAAAMTGDCASQRFRSAKSFLVGNYFLGRVFVPKPRWYWVHAPRRIDPQKGVSIACGLWGKFDIVGTIWLVLSIESAVALRDWLSCATIHSYLYSCFRGGKDEFQIFFPTCQVRVVRFYVSLLRFLLLLFFFLVLLPRPPSSPSSSCCPVPSVSLQPPCPVSAGNRDHRRSVFPAGPQPRPSLHSVPSRTSTATICTQCSLPDLDRDRNNFSHDRILSNLKRCLSGIALMFGPRAGLARPRGGLAGARYYPVHWARLHVTTQYLDIHIQVLFLQVVDIISIARASGTSIGPM